jgi:hypothetical protein
MDSAHLDDLIPVAAIDIAISQESRDGKSGDGFALGASLGRS